MKKFWKWMIEKEYCESFKNEEEYYIVSCDQCGGVNFSKQMLIGYMIEYLWDKWNINAMWLNFEFNNTYNNLENEIKTLDKK